MNHLRCDESALGVEFGLKFEPSRILILDGLQGGNIGVGLALIASGIKMVSYCVNMIFILRLDELLQISIANANGLRP